MSIHTHVTTLPVNTHTYVTTLLLSILILDTTLSVCLAHMCFTEMMPFLSKVPGSRLRATFVDVFLKVFDSLFLNADFIYLYYLPKILHNYFQI